MSTPNAHYTTAQTRYSQLQSRATSFCAAFLDLASNPPQKILSEHFTSTTTPKITEHGPAWASSRLPFLGKTFSGRDGCLEYFELLAKTLEFVPDENTFPGKEGFVVDDRADGGLGGSGEGAVVWQRPRGQVSVKGKAKFKAVETGKEWKEEFIYRLSEFDEDGMIGHWEIWADPLSAWIAVGGETAGK